MKKQKEIVLFVERIDGQKKQKLPFPLKIRAGIPIILQGRMKKISPELASAAQK
jgi:hypothetical protein